LCPAVADEMLIFAIFFLAVSADTEWVSWVRQHNVEIEADQHELRHQIWADNLKKINEHNSNPDKTFTMGMNEFGHLTTAEYAQKMVSHTPTPKSSTHTHAIKSQPGAPPDSWDWRSKGFVGAVKDQSQCGSDWAVVPVDQVSSLCAISGNIKYKQGSIGQIESCANPGQCCDGGDYDLAYGYMQKHGLALDDGSECGPCNSTGKPFCRVMTITSLPAGDEHTLKNVVYTAGPVAVVIDASHTSFQFYTAGVYYEPACGRNPSLDHGLLVVGYGSLNGLDYWIAQNSWGPNWGMQGYILLARNRQNNCGVASAGETCTVRLA